MLNCRNVIVCSLMLIVCSCGEKETSTKKKPESKEQKNYTLEELFSDPDMSATFAKQKAKELASLLPAEVLARQYPIVRMYTEKNSIREALEYFWRVDVKRQLKIIKKGIAELEKGPTLKITILLDSHPVLQHKQTEESLRRQALISEYVRTSSPEVVFKENDPVDEMTWASFLQELAKWEPEALANATKIGPEEFFGNYKANGLHSWHFDYIGQSDQKIFGVEDYYLGTLIPTLFMFVEESLNRNVYLAGVMNLNFVWRDQIMLAHIVQQMRKHGYTEALFVVGQAHETSLTVLCKQWGIDVQVVSLE